MERLLKQRKKSRLPLSNLLIENLLMPVCGVDGLRYTAKEMLVREEESDRYLPSGASCLVIREGRNKR